MKQPLNLLDKQIVKAACKNVNYASSAAKIRAIRNLFQSKVVKNDNQIITIEHPCEKIRTTVRL